MHDDCDSDNDDDDSGDETRTAMTSTMIIFETMMVTATIR
jgi:hypothetical protein